MQTQQQQLQKQRDALQKQMADLQKQLAAHQVTLAEANKDAMCIAVKSHCMKKILHVQKSAFLPLMKKTICFLKRVSST